MGEVPELGTYVSQDNHFKIQIDSANGSTGQLTGIYASNNSPEGGDLTQKGQIGSFGWVYSQTQGKSGVAPFVITINGSSRPDGFPYCVIDNWTGAYRPDNTLLLAGARSHVNSKGVVEVTSLGTMTFKR